MSATPPELIEIIDRYRNIIRIIEKFNNEYDLPIFNILNNSQILKLITLTTCAIEDYEKIDGINKITLFNTIKILGGAFQFGVDLVNTIQTIDKLTIE